MKKKDHQIVQQVLDGEVSREDFDNFQKRLRVEPELVKTYGEYAMLHHALTEEFESGAVPELPTPTTHARATVPWSIAALAIGLIGFVIYWRSSKLVNGPLLLAEVRFSDDAVWRADDVPHDPQKPLSLPKGSTLELMLGIAEISLNSGNRAFIQAPSSLTMVEENSMHLSKGRGRFFVGRGGQALVVTTPSMHAEDLGTEFGVEVPPDEPDEIHVFKGKVEVRINGTSKGEILAAGEAGRVTSANQIDRTSVASDRFPTQLQPFRTVIGAPFVRENWRNGFGNPTVSEDRIQSENFSTFMTLPETVPTEKEPVMLAMFTTHALTDGVFHTDGWSGLSFFDHGNELLFYGDSFGPEVTWSLDIKQRMPVVLPGNPVIGPHTVTLRYDSITGEVSLHEGRPPLKAAFCAGKLPPGSHFDEIRLGASASAALNVGGIKIRIGGSSR